MKVAIPLKTFVSRVKLSVPDSWVETPEEREALKLWVDEKLRLVREDLERKLYGEPLRPS